VGTGFDLTIHELAKHVASVVGYLGMINWDSTKPDGTPKKQLDVSRLASLVWQANIPLDLGLARTVDEYRASLLR
jgi:GDP-L-fucose synthase